MRVVGETLSRSRGATGVFYGQPASVERRVEINFVVLKVVEPWASNVNFLLRGG
jgi:hypothetical protein